MRARSSFILHPSSLRPAFTLTEILIVIGIIVLVLALAVPALNIISGSRSIDGAENNVSAMLGRARADAIGVQREHGIFFFLDPATQRVMLAEVRNPGEVTAEPIPLDLVPDRDFLPLPKGVGAQTIDNAVIGAMGRDDDGYLGYNTVAGTVTTFVPYGGVILFDGKGQLVSKRYFFVGSKPPPTAGPDVPTDIYRLLMTGEVAGAVAGTGDNIIPPSTPGSQFGLIMFDREAFLNNGNNIDSQIDPVGAGAYGVTEKGEESWLDQNSTALMINRYNGTLVRGE